MPAAVVEQNDRQTASSSMLDEIVRMSGKFFAGPISVEVMSDPDAPSVSWTVLNVESAGSPKEIIKTQCEWHEWLARQFPEAVSTIRLSIDPHA